MKSLHYGHSECRNSLSSLVCVSVLVVFVAFAQPSVGLAQEGSAGAFIEEIVTTARKKSEAFRWAVRGGGRWWIRWPVAMLAVPISAAFAIILSLTRYVSWNGAFSLIENHVFLLPAPFWL